MNYQWKSPFLSNKKNIFSGGLKVGELSNKSFSKDSHAYLKDVKLKFTQKGVFSSDFFVHDFNTQEYLGDIHYDFWGTKAEITFKDIKASFKPRNFWSTEWAIEQEGKDVVSINSNGMNGGEITSQEGSDLMVLLALFLTNDYIRRTAFIMIISLIIIL